MTKFGIVIPQHDITPEEMLDAVQLAESSNLASIWFADHLQGRPKPTRPILEGWSCLSAAAATTKRITIGMLAIRAGLRSPRLLSTMAAAAGAIAPGRITICLGIGDQSIRQEQTAYGIPLQPKPQRLTGLTESIKALKKETPKVRVWVGGVSPEIIGAALVADGWNAWTSPEDFPTHLRAYREANGTGETSWAGSWPGPQAINSLTTAGAAHIIIATGAKNYADRITQLSK
jgi:alkanesulfonate monooxygenase SsuD/methylene tetrahydromethanopterin reductase-like flavin-dependent oxidoreductase (luciferase family)